jgi:ribulose-5-phosphate 4-epimerase/fuculose-1-phosphate aldolase
MGETYVGTKFRTRFARREAPSPHPSLQALIEACRRLSTIGLAADGAGNASVRGGTGFFVTRTAVDLGALTLEDLVEVLSCDPTRAELVVAGLHEPSSESLLHAGVYAARPDVSAVLHGHDDDLVARALELGLPVTAREQPYGTAALVEEVRSVLETHAFVVIRGHGFVALGGTAGEALRRIEETLSRARA